MNTPKMFRVILSLLLLVIITISTYLYFFYKQNSPFNSINRTEYTNTNTTDNPNNNQTANLPISGDTTAMNFIADTSANVTEKHTSKDSIKVVDKQGVANSGKFDSNIISLVPTKDTPYFNKTDLIESSYELLTDNEKAKLVSISKNSNIVCKVYGGKKQRMLVYPTNTKWSNIRLLVPKGQQKTSRKNLLHPEYQGVSYPSFKTGSISYKNKTYDVLQVSFDGTVVDENHPYSILLNSDSEFLIFGDSNKKDIYIYEGGVVDKLSNAVIENVR